MDTALWPILISAAFSLAFTAITPLAALKLLRRRRRGQTPLPPVTILKPLKGEDRELYGCLASFCSQDYPRFQILFAVSSPQDAAVEVVERLKKDFPAVDMELVVSSNRIGCNPKINNISNAYPLAKHDLLLLSDSDIRVEPDFLRRATVEFADARVGAATCFYRSAVPKSLCGMLESFSVNSQFLPQALVAGACGMRFIMGAATLVRRDVFEEIGGFARLADHLADDFALGQAVLQAGRRLAFCEVVVEAIPDIKSPQELLKHQIRWARTIRLCNPLGYLGLLISHGFSLASLALLFLGWQQTLAALCLGIWAAKAAAAWTILRLSGASHPLPPLLLLPLGEWLSFAAWLSGLKTSRINWRGELYTVCSRGRLSLAE